LLKYNNNNNNKQNADLRDTVTTSRETTRSPYNSKIVIVECLDLRRVATPEQLQRCLPVSCFKFKFITFKQPVAAAVKARSPIAERWVRPVAYI